MLNQQPVSDGSILRWCTKRLLLPRSAVHATMSVCLALKKCQPGLPAASAHHVVGGWFRYEQAFNDALSAEDVEIVIWLCQHLEPAEVLSRQPAKLSQTIILALIQQLGQDLQQVSFQLPHLPPPLFCSSEPISLPEGSAPCAAEYRSHRSKTMSGFRTSWYVAADPQSIVAGCQ